MAAPGQPRLHFIKKEEKKNKKKNKIEQGLIGLVRWKHQELIKVFLNYTAEANLGT